MDNDLPPASPGTPEPQPGTPEPAAPQPQSAPKPNVPPVITPPRLSVISRPRNYGWKIAVALLAGLLLISLFTNFWRFGQSMSLAHRSGSGTRHAGPRLEETVVEEHHSANKILLVPVEGVISGDAIGSSMEYSMVEYLRDQFKLAEEDSEVKAVILKVDSPGGEVLASDEIYQVISQFQKKSGKPVVASMGSMAASGGYYISAPCRWIVANELTLTGSIGVIFHSFNYRDLMDKVGVRPEVYKSGKYKDMLSGSKKESEITPEERQMIQKLIDETFGRFKTVVSDGRQWANKENKQNKDDKGRVLATDWAEYADGRVLSGKEAYQLGFVDELGNFEAALARTRQLAGISTANVVQYHQVFDLSNFFRLLGKSEPAKLKIDVGFAPPKLKAGHLYFLAPTFVQ